MEKPAANTQTESSSKTAAIFRWIELIGILVFVIAGFAFGRDHWLRFASLLLIAAGFIYKTYAVWKTGNKKAFWLRVALFLVGLVVALYFGYRAVQTQ